MPEKLTKKEQAERDAARALVRAEGTTSAETVDADENPHPLGTARHGAWIRMRERARRDAAWAKANPPAAPEAGSL